jgi:hypothetical protein
MFLDDEEAHFMSQHGVLIGAQMTRTSSGYSIAGMSEANFSSDLASKLLVRISRATD